jgi:hypothetical protein
MDPFAGIGFDDAHHFGDRVNGPNANQHVNMVGDAVDDQRRGTHFADNAAEVGEQVGLYFRCDKKCTLFRGENQMDDDVAAGLGHVSFALSGLGFVDVYPG